MERAGTAYGIMLADDRKPPSSVQIRDGFDSHNNKVLEGRHSF